MLLKSRDFCGDMAYIIFMNRSFALTILSVLLLSGCLSTTSRAPVTAYGAGEGEGSAGVHIVQGGDTLWSISKRYDIAMNEIVYTNEMSAPFMLNSGQRLKLPPPNDYRVRGGDSLYSISRLFDVSTSDIARMNNLSAPYHIHAGQTLKLPSTIKHSAPTYSQAALQKPLDLRPNSTAVKPSAKPSNKPNVAHPDIAKPPPRSGSSFLKPVNGRIISGYGPKQGGLHNDGVNIAAPRGTAVSAAENGVVVYSGSDLKGYGNLVLMRHDGGYMTAYAHMHSVGVSKGQVIKRGQSIGSVGSTGSVSTPQLHFEVRKGTKAIDPKGYI